MNQIALEVILNELSASLTMFAIGYCYF